jgi:hypothetical protein
MSMRLLKWNKLLRRSLFSISMVMRIIHYLIRFKSISHLAEFDPLPGRNHLVFRELSLRLGIGIGTFDPRTSSLEFLLFLDTLRRKPGGVITKRDYRFLVLLSFCIGFSLDLFVLILSLVSRCDSMNVSIKVLILRQLIKIKQNMS